jgi:hypothetical protein
MGAKYRYKLCVELIGLSLVALQLALPLQAETKLLTTDHEEDEILEQFEEILVGEVLIHQQQVGLHVVHVVLFHFSILHTQLTHNILCLF